MKLPVYNIVVGEGTEIEKMSLVESPAVEVDFLKFSKEVPIKFSVDEEQHIVFGCALRADFPIYRRDGEYEYYVNFTKDTINKLYQKFLITNKFNDVNLDHSVDTSGVHLIQSFIKDKSKGIDPVGFEDIADGSWFCAYKVVNEEVWKEVKEGKLRGFSVEGLFSMVEVPNKESDEIDALIDDILG